ncbi:unnamed protein product [Lepidochelys kempii]
MQISVAQAALWRGGMEAPELPCLAPDALGAPMGCTLRAEVAEGSGLDWSCCQCVRAGSRSQAALICLQEPGQGAVSVLTHEPAPPPDLADLGARTVPPAGPRSRRPLNRTVWDGDGTLGLAQSLLLLPEAGGGATLPTWQLGAPHKAGQTGRLGPT